MNTSTRLTIIAVALISLLTMTGCAGMGQKIETPKLNLVNITLLSAGIIEQRYGIRLRVQNPNAISLPIRGVTYEIKLAGASFATGVTPEPFNVPKYGETEFDIEVRTNLLSSARQLAAWYSSGSTELDYELGGKLDIGLSFMKRAIPFSETGRINLTR